MKQLSVSKGMMTQEEADHYEAEYIAAVESGNLLQVGAAIFLSAEKP
jgi:hypothetical protein